MSGILDKCVFVIDQFIPLKKKVELIRMIKTNGGISVYSVSEKSTHLITSQEGFNESSAKVTAAINGGLHVVSKEFVVDSIAQGSKQEEKNYYFNRTHTIPPSPSFAAATAGSTPGLTVTIPSRPAPSPQTSASSSSSSPRSPPGFNNIRAPNLQVVQPVDKKAFNRLRVDVTRPTDLRSPQPTPSPRSLYSDTPRSDDDDDEDDDDDDDEEEEDETSDDEDEDEDEEEDFGNGKPSFRDVLEQSNRDVNKQSRAWESATPQYGAEDDGCKIFVGGIMFDDLEALKKTKDGYSASEDVIAHIQKLKNERLIEIIRIFSRFGTVVRVKQFLEKRHIFITYDNKNSALQALRALKPLEVRKKIVQEVRERLRAEDRQTLVSPRSNFYVRWPHHVEAEDGYSSNSRSYFSSGSSAPSSPTGSSLPTQKLSWRQPQSPSAYPYQRSYFTQNNFSSASRTSSMRSYFSNSESEHEGSNSNSNNLNSFSESESAQYSRAARSQHYQQQRVHHQQQQQQQQQQHIDPPSSSSSSFSSSINSKPALSESDSDAPSTGIRHRVIDRTPDDSPASSAASSTVSSPALHSTSSSSVDSTHLPLLSSSTSSSSTSQPSSLISSHNPQKRRGVNEEGNWHKVLVLLLVLASMAIVYLYNK